MWKKHGLKVYSSPQSVRYRFAGGGRSVSKVLDTMPVGLGGVCGEISSSRVDDCDTPLLLSLQAQKNLGCVLDLPNMTVT